jgi:hypothetical protein
MKFRFKENATAEIGSENPFYALTDGGYLDPEDVLADQEQAKQVQQAVKVVKAFIDACFAEGVIEEA